MMVSTIQIKSIADQLDEIKNIDNDVSVYFKTNKQKYHNKKVDGFKFKDLPITFISENGITVYELVHNKNKIRIEVGTSMFNKAYPLTMLEILNILNFYNLLDLLSVINIHYIERPNSQAFVKCDASTKKKNGIDKELSLFIPCKDMVEKEKKLGYPDTLRFSAFRILLHEISHALGNIGSDSGCEPEADRFSYIETSKWLKANIIDFKGKEIKKDNETDDFGF